MSRAKRRRFNRAARTMLPALLAMKDRIRARWEKIGYDREDEYAAVLKLNDELLNAVLDDTDLPDARAGAVLGAISAFISSTYWRESAHDQEDE
jgi:hypothetical protein